MMSDRKGSPEATIRQLPIFGQYNRQRFVQFSPEDSANFYLVPVENGKRPYAMYPTFGRKHISYLGINRLIFAAQPRAIFRSINYVYIVVGNQIFQIDDQYNQREISGGLFLTSGGNVFFDFIVAVSITFACFVDGRKIYVFNENTNSFQVVTDPNAPINPTYIATFGNRIVVSQGESSQFNLSVSNLLTAGVFDPATCFTINGQAVFAQESGIIRQLGVLNNTLYIFTDFTTGIWANIAAVFSVTQTTFPFKKNSTYDWNFGMADPLSLDINFGYLAFLAQNKDGLLQVMYSAGDTPEKLSSKAIDVLIQRYTNALGNRSPFLGNALNGFLYQYENTIFYRISGGDYTGNGILDQEQTGQSVEFGFDGKEWHRCIELNGERNRVHDHVFFNNKHLVSVIGDNTVYEMSGSFYTNEITNPQSLDPQNADAYLTFPMRMERITPVISQDDYSEFETEYIEIDFVFGESNIVFSTAPFENAQFLITEMPGTDGNPVYIISENLDADGQPIYILGEGGNTPSVNELTYNALYKPSIELFWSDDGGVSFLSADVREFSQQGKYQWRMRWYQLGASRNRVYKLICVSPVPIVILGAVMNVRRVSGGAN